MAGQTKSEIRALLAAADLSPRHRFGQNFLIDLNLMRKLVAAADLQPGDVVLEVGCGTGSLTELLLEAPVRVVGVEIDHGLQRILRARLGEHPRFTLVQGDALAGKHRVNPLVLRVLSEQPPEATGGYKLVANLPYQIATPLVMELLYATPRPDLLVCTVQKEVGERLAAQPGTSAYGPVSVIVPTLARLRPIAIVPPTAFWPRPQVESLMLAIRPHDSPEVAADEVPAFVQFVQGGFRQRRKKLRNTLPGCDASQALLAFARARVSPDARAEALSPAQWRSLFAAVRWAPNR